MRLVLFSLIICHLTFSLQADEELSGGEGTVFQTGKNAFALPLTTLSREQRRAHIVGNSFFNKNWVIAPASTEARDGLGPFFLARSCSGCHVHDGRGSPSPDAAGLLFRLAHSDVKLFGEQLGTIAIPGVAPEGTVDIQYRELPGSFADGTTYSLREPVYTITTNPTYGKLSAPDKISPRIAPPVFGLGLLEAIPEAQILANADPEDKDQDGISGRANQVLDIETNRTSLGRFGWKANQPNLRQQTSAAFVGDLGITTSIHPDEALTDSQKADINYISGGSPEIEDHILERIVTYQRTLAPPARRNLDDPAVIRGKQLFHQAKCANCHTPSFKTIADATNIDALAGQTIYPYTDLLLHDMGEALADNRPDTLASGAEWRTPPLWGIGLTEAVSGHQHLLHDGRARGLSEAILWHGGEAKASREVFRNMPLEQRNDLLAFLNSL